ncbi:MAG: histidine kinase [Rhodoferax sp.]
MNQSDPLQPLAHAWARFTQVAVAAYHRYGNWLVSITWKRFFASALVLLIGMGILHDSPPFSWTYIEVRPGHELPKPAQPPQPPKVQAPAQKDKSSHTNRDGIDIVVNKRGVLVTAIPASPASAASSVPPAQPASAVNADEVRAAATSPEIHITLPPGANSDTVREAIEQAKNGFRESMEESSQDAKQAAEDARSIAEDARDTAREMADAWRSSTRIHTYGESLMPLTLWFILLSGILKITYKGKVQAEAKAAQATEVAESESLKRQIIEARMAAMQAQVEPHFLFNTLASIDHLIETDPPRASIMQKNLIALLRASMPTMREANAQGTRDLGKELAVIRPYLEILKVRMEERLQTEVRVSDGLLSAEFPPMMLQSLVENAIKHGLEPKAEGGQLTVSAEIVHGKLAVTVADTGLGFGVADTAGTGIGLSNIRERLALLYGGKASLSVTETAGGGTTVTITVPYVLRAEA